MPAMPGVQDDRVDEVIDPVADVYEAPTTRLPDLSGYALSRVPNLERFRIVLVALEGSHLSPPGRLVGTVRRRDRAALALRIRRVEHDLALLAYALEQPAPAVDDPSPRVTSPAGGGVVTASGSGAHPELG
jgi:hypothetical protein